MEPWPPRQDAPPPPPTPPAYGQWGQGWTTPPPQQPSWGRPTGPSVVIAVLLWVLSAGALVATLVFAGLAALGFWMDDQLDANGVTTTAEVTDVNRFADTYTVEFTTADDRVIVAEVMFPSSTPAVGDQVEITYHSEDPHHVVEAGSPEDIIMGVIYSFAAVIALAVAVGAVIGAVLVHRARGRAQRQTPAW